MELSPGFHRVRTGLFTLLTFISMLWVVLLCVEIFVLYDRSDVAQRNLVGILIFINAITAIMLPALIIFVFRSWLDATRLLFLTLIHVGTALLFTIRNAGFECPTNPSQRRVCLGVNVAITACVWVVPALLIWYTAFLGVSYFLWHQDRKKPQEKFSENRLSELPMMMPSSRRPSLGPEMTLPSNNSNVPPASHKAAAPPPVQRPTNPLPLPPGAQPPAHSKPPQPPQYRPGQQGTPSAIAPSYSYLSNSRSLNTKTMTGSQPPRAVSTRWSQPQSTSAYSFTPSSRSLHNSHPPLNVQTPVRQVSQPRPLSARPPAHQPSPPSTSQGHSRSSHARLLALALPPSQPVQAGDSSPKSSGRLAKPAPWAY